VQHRFFSDNQIDLWYVLLHGLADARLLNEYRSFLPPDDVAQERKFALQESRVQHLVSRVLVRSVLSNYTGHDPRAWVFARNAYGKPAISHPAGLPLEFNLSHTRGLVCCAVTVGRAVGLDAEGLTEIPNSLELAKRCFAPEEFTLLTNTTAVERNNVFARIWTLKEAFVKACGFGLSLPLDEFAFRFSKDRPPVVSIADSHRLEPSRWQFAEAQLASRFQISLAVEMPASCRLAVRVRQTVPLHWTSDEFMLPFSPSNDWCLKGIDSTRNDCGYGRQGPVDQRRT
jgi:4'-phosphopantetheinyl transferase